MAIALAIFSGAVIALSLFGVTLPRRLTALVRRFVAGRWLWFAVAVRLLLAVLLWYTAPVSHTPGTFRVLALLMLLAAIAIPLVGGTRLTKLIDRVASWPTVAIRLQCTLGVAFGTFLLWSVSPGLGAL